MNRHLYPLILPYFAVIIFILIYFPAISCSNAEKYTRCSSSYRCGNINITYPFYGVEHRPAYCGYPGFEVSCVSNVFRIEISSLTYRVLETDSTSQTLTVARDDYWGKYCVDHVYNTTVEDSDIFKYASMSQNLTLYYSCPTSLSTALPSNHYSCTINGSVNIGFYMTGSDSSVGALLGTCNSSVRLPVSYSAIETLSNTPTLDTLIAVIDAGFSLEWLANNTLCDACDESGGQCGRNVTSGEFICYCVDKAYASSTCSGRAFSFEVIVGFVTSSAGTVIVILYICCLREIVKGSTLGKNDLVVDAFIRNYGSLAPKQYKYSEVKKMTNSFRDKLGQGGYGCVYKGKLSDGQLVAVKVLSDSKGNGEDFLNEVASISRTSHVNVVTLLGFSYEGGNSALIYEFMPNGSLDLYIYTKPSSNANYHLQWSTLSEIAIGIARGLEYLHSGCNTRILHFDIKPHNILLDQDFCPKISDFGLPRLCQRKESIITMTGMRGTVGYIAPEVISRLFGRVSYKSDVYSYGMMLLEMTGGKKKPEVGLSQTSEIYFPHWIYKQLETGTELRLDHVTTEEEEVTARKMIVVGLWCIQTKPSDRPTMSKVVEMLEGNVQSLQIPLKPVIYSPPRSPSHSSTLSSFS